MIKKAAIAAIVLLAFCFPFSVPYAAPPDAKAIDSFVAQRVTTLGLMDDDLRVWDAKLRSELASHRDPLNVTEDLARSYGLSLPQMQRLEELWFQASELSRGIIHSMDGMNTALSSLDEAFLLLVRDSHHNRLVVDAAAVIAGFNGRCNVETFRAMLAGAPNVADTGWRVLQTHSCTQWREVYAQLAPEKLQADLVDLGKWNTLPRAQQLALSSYLSSEGFAPSLPAADRIKLRIYFADAYLQQLFASELVTEGIAFFDGLPAEIREPLNNNSLQDAEVAIDGLKIKLSVSEHRDDLRLTMAAARFVNGDGRGARANAPFWPMMHAHLVLACWNWLSGESWLGEFFAAFCNPTRNETLRKAALLDLTLNYPAADAYGYFEVFNGMQFVVDSTATVWGMFLCKRLENSEYTRYCDLDREFRAQSAAFAVEADALDSSREMVGLFETASAGRLDTLVNTYQSKLVALAKTYADVPQSLPIAAERGDATPLPSPFVQHAMPSQFRRAEHEGAFNSPALPPEYARLPDGYFPVRIEQQENTVVVISASQNLDPTGESTRGGYWVHISRDAGKTWERPLYTGLAERFPYVVVGSSSLPMIADETLNTEVEIELIGRAQTVPALSIPSTRSETGLYLEIPLALLRADSDGDGITDIVEKHLLLDPANPDSDGDGIPDGQDPMPNVTRGPPGNSLQQAIGRIVELLSSKPKGAIIGPLEVPKDSPDFVESYFARTLFGEPLSADSPILLAGRPEDYAGLNPSRVMLVYDADGMRRMRRMIPDFGPLSFSEITLNRSRTRGFLSWTAGGFTGGSFRLSHHGDDWTFWQMGRWFI